jgi:hypothetical protein
MGLMMKQAAYIVLLLVANSVSAQSMYRCTKAGVSSYQDRPCEGMVVPSSGPAKTMATPADTAPKQMPGAVASIPNANNKAMDEAYQRHMALGEFSVAKSYATTDAQRNTVANKLAQLQAQCASMAIRAQQAEADNKHMNGRRQHAAEAASAQYRLKCGALHN